jgi:probable aminopeptidase NPEPL1
LIALEHVDHALAAVAGLARAYPTWTAVASPERAVDVVLLGPDGPIPITPLLQATARAVRLAAHWTDTPPDRLGPDALVTAANAVARELPGVSVHSVRGDALREHGLNLLHAVGRAALQSPALVVLDYAPEGATAHHAWVGKGICYDTGGLSIKPRANMTGMKMDMAGAAAVLAAFDAAVRAGSDKRLTAVLCIAENAVGPAAIRPDDVVVGYSGKSVEINNTDAEGRLVLADGLAWVMRHRAPDRVVDIATLTGAQSAAVGRGIGAVYAPNEDLEAWAMRIGLAAAEPMHPLPVAPEWWRPELSSPVADMRNSAKNRDNAGSAVAAHFLAEHLGEAVDRWVHLDIAGRANHAGRATGFGTAWLIRSLYEP